MTQPITGLNTGEPGPEPNEDSNGDVYVLPASFAQQRMWFLNELEPESAFYNIPTAVRLEGQLDVQALEWALNEIIRRHETLRTTFAAQDGQPYQVISPEGQIALETIDLTALPPGEREPQVIALAEQEARQPFNLAQGPLLRARLVQLGAESHVVLLTMHHIISDGWSMGVLVREIAILYSAYRSGQPSPLPELPIQYADYALWQRERLQDNGLNDQLAFWLKQLEGELPVLKLPTDRPRGAMQTFRGVAISRLIPNAIREGLNRFSRSQDATLYMTLLAAFQVLLYRYTGQDDFTIGSPIANRSRAEVEGLIGLFINTLVLRANLAGQEEHTPLLSFRELLQRVRATTLAAYANQDLPFDTLVEALHPDRSLGYNPLFQVMFILQNATAGSYELPGLRISMLDIDTGTATFDLTLSISEGEDGLSADLEYNTDLFDAPTAQQLLAHFEVLLRGILANPDQAITHLPLLETAERKQILADWNANRLVDPRQAWTIPQLLAQAAERSAERTAVCWTAPEVGTRQAYTYQELHARANQLAHHLQAAGVGPGKIVGLCMERGLEMIIALLGVLKAGGAYLPLDPNSPVERLEFMLKDAGICTLLTQERLLAVLPAHDAATICLDRDWPIIANRPDTAPISSCGPDDLVYLIYTSGSTGKPKGVQVLQRHLVNQFLAWETTYQLTPEVVHLQMANFAFDVFSADLVRSLGSGGKLVLCPREYLLDPARLYALLCAEQVTIAEFVPAVLRALVQHLRSTGQTLAFMQRLICGSDVWYVDEFRQMLELCGEHTRLINSFGLTEATIDSSYFDERVINLPGDAIVPIGRPFANNRLYILDRFFQPLPIGVPGELYVGGAAVAAGYHNRPDLTAERFIPDPFSTNPTDRLYKTGDLARYHPDGNIEFLGRLDFQVKIRGFRVEIGEIETALKQIPAVQDAVVSALTPNRAGGRTDPILVAYLVTRGEEQPAVDLLRAALRASLPDYMLPSIFLFLEKLPLTSNGKVDRKALPAPDWSSELFGQTYTPPRTNTELALADLWAQILGVEHIGVESNFFELGGHSLLATQVISRIRGTFGIELPLRKIFEAPTLAELAAAIDMVRPDGSIGPATVTAAGEVPILPALRDRPIPLSFAQQRLWFMDQLEPDSPFYNIPEAFHLTGCLDLSALEGALNEVIRRHEVLRTCFATDGDQPIQVITPQLTLSIPLTDLSALTGERQEQAVTQHLQEEAREPFHLATCPLLRVRLLKLAAEEHVILVTMHHIIGDDWSTNILVQEIAQLYSAYQAGLPSPLAELPIQYADFAAWQRGYLQGEVLARYDSYWKQQLAGCPPLLELPTDHPRPAVQTYKGAYLPFQLSAEITSGLNALAQREGVSMFMVLLAAFQTLMMRYSGQEDICVGAPIANRNRADIENLIGFFVNTLVFRTDLSGEHPGEGPGFRELLKRVREVCLGAYAYQDLPFERVVELAQPDRNLSHNPLFQVMLVLQNVPQRGEELPGLNIRPLEAHSGTAKFDLTLFMLEENGHLGGALEYSTELFEPETIQRMCTHLQLLLEGILRDPDLPVGRLPMLSEAERKLIIDEWNQTETPFPAGLLTHQLFEAQVQRTPQAVAVIFQDQSLTYQELDQRANQLAHYLRRNGAAPDMAIGICLERSLELMVGLLGILKAGAAYLPLDPHYPADRLSFMLADAGVSILLTQARLLEHLPAAEARAVCLDRDWPAIAAEPETAPTCPAGPDNLAYIIYTSGSTGRPKGAMILHIGLTNYLSWCLQAYPLDRGIGTPVHSSISFDLTVTSLYPALLRGKTVFMLPEELGVEALGEFLRDHEDCSLIKITPAHLKLLSEQVSAERAAHTTHAFIIGGENLLVDHVDFWQQNAPATDLVNEYGPTETVVGCCVYWAPPGKHQSGVIPIGKPIINTRLYILDPCLQPVPVGVRGELYIGGVGVARGYHNRLELTGERFLPDPFSPEPGARMYKTGDLVRWLPDGNMECLGRIDFQVKIRGFRVELGEVEAILAQHPDVKEGIVWVREDAPHRPGASGMPMKRLVAYVVPQDSTEPPKPGDLRDFLKGRLPDYMVPAAFVILDALPITPNGKLDRKALPDPGPVRPDLGTGYLAPQTPAERILVEIWKTVLGLEQVGVEDNFFELGGDSILSLQIISRARQRGLALSPRLLFEHPTIVELAKQAEGSAVTEAEQGLVQGDAPLTPIQQWFFAQEFADEAHWNQSILINLSAHLDPGHLDQALRALLTQHDSLRVSFPASEAGQRTARFGSPPAAGSPLSELVCEDFSTLPAEEQPQALAQAYEALQASLDLEHGPVFRLGAYALGPAGTRLLFVAHHLVMDVVSWPILLEDLYTALRALQNQQTIVMVEKTTSYKRWAESLAGQSQSEAVLSQLPYWLEQVETPAAQLPLDYPGGQNTEADGQVINTRLSVVDTQRLLTEATNTYHCDVPTLLLTALLLTLRERTGEPDWRIELESHGRETDGSGAIDLSRTVGWFTSLYPLLFQAGQHTSRLEVLWAVKQALSKLPKLIQGYGLLRFAHLDPTIRQRLAVGQPQITFNYLGRMGTDSGSPAAQAEFAISGEAHGSERSPRNRRASLWEINGGVMEGQLQLEWAFSRAVHRPETVEHLVGLFQKHLMALLSGIDADQPAATTALLPENDFSAFGWDSSDVEQILGKLLPGDPDEQGNE